MVNAKTGGFGKVQINGRPVLVEPEPPELEWLQSGGDARNTNNFDVELQSPDEMVIQEVYPDYGFPLQYQHVSTETKMVTSTFKDGNESFVVVDKESLEIEHDVTGLGGDLYGAAIVDDWCVWSGAFNDDIAYAINVETGDTWTLTLSDANDQIGPDLAEFGAKSLPLGVNGGVVIVSEEDDGENGVTLNLDPETGNIDNHTIQSVDGNAYAPFNSKPVAVEDESEIYYATDTGHFVRIDTDSWTSDEIADGLDGERFSISEGGVAFFQSTSSSTPAFAYDLIGEEILWETEETDYDFDIRETSSPALDENRGEFYLMIQETGDDGYSFASHDMFNGDVLVNEQTSFDHGFTADFIGFYSGQTQKMYQGIDSDDNLIVSIDVTTGEETIIDTVTVNGWNYIAPYDDKLSVFYLNSDDELEFRAYG